MSELKKFICTVVGVGVGSAIAGPLGGAVGATTGQFLGKLTGKAVGKGLYSAISSEHERFGGKANIGDKEIKTPPIPDAYKHYAEAVASGDGDAMFAIGHGYEEGIGVRKSIAEAIKWYRVAKKAGSSDADKRLFAFGLS